MEKKKKLWTGLAGFLAIMLILLTGCQAVGNLDLNKALQTNLAVHSGEGNSSISIDIEMDETALQSDKERAVLQMFQSVRIDLTDMKTQDMYTASMKGNLHFSNGDIPFVLALNKTQIAIQVEGAKKPIVLDLAKLVGETLGEEELGPIVTDQLFAKAQDLSGYLFINLPNPQTISLENVKDTVHGETLDLNKVHAEVYGDEILELVKQSLENILNDDEGLKELLGQLYDALAPIITETLKSGMNADDPSSAMINQFLQDRTLAVDFMFITVKPLLQQLLDEWNTKTTAGIQAEIVKDFDIFNHDNVAKADLYFDSNNYLRKYAFDLALKPMMNDESTVKSIKISAAGERWNINGAVTADAIDVSNGFQITTETTPSHVLSWFDQNSKIYDVLKNDLHITRKLFNLKLTSEKESAWYGTAYIKNNVTMVPARFVSEQLDAEISFDNAKKQILILDVLSGKTIFITIGKNTATVDGVLVKLADPAIMKNGTLYVPLQSLTNFFGVNKSWDAPTRQIIISRD